MTFFRLAIGARFVTHLVTEDGSVKVFALQKTTATQAVYPSGPDKGFTQAFAPDTYVIPSI